MTNFLIYERRDDLRSKLEVVTDLHNFSKDLRENMQTGGGCYQLTFWLAHPCHVRIGRLGTFDFQTGYYIYTGCHKKHLGQRVQRHLKHQKKIYWHIDYLTTHPQFTLREVVLFPGLTKECMLHQSLRKLTGAGQWPVGFGNGDCTSNCRSHLLHLKTRPGSVWIEWIQKMHGVRFNISAGNERILKK